MRVLFDYRPALRERTGVGEYAHQLARALLAGSARNGARPLELALFSSSWKDRLTPSADLEGAAIVDRRIPGALLNLAWHRLGWPAAEALAGRAVDVAHSLHPLLMPSRAAAQVVTIYDLDFLAHPERTEREIRRDYPALAREHAHRADAVIVISEFTSQAVQRDLGVPADRIAVCTPGAPPWRPRKASVGGYILFMGTLEPRKNVGGLLDAYERLLTRRRDVPRLVIAGKATEQSGAWLDRITRPPLDGHVDRLGYVAAADRRGVFEGARLLAQPSFEEGFGMPVLEAMTLGVPVVAANRGALPEVVGDAGPLVDPENPDQLAGAIERLMDDHAFAEMCAAKGIARAQLFSWDAMARGVYAAYERAIQRRCG